MLYDTLNIFVLVVNLVFLWVLVTNVI